MKTHDARADAARRQSAARHSPVPVQAAFQGQGLQAALDASPHMRAQRRAIDAAFGLAGRRQANGEASSATGAGPVVQRVKLKTVFNALKDDLNQLATFGTWIQERAGDKLVDWQHLLSLMTLDEVKETLVLYAKRIEGEKKRNAITIEEVIENGGDMGPPLPDKTTDVSLLSSPHIGDFIAEKQSNGINVAGQVVALDDSEFTERHWQELLLQNQHIEMSSSQKATLKLHHMAKVDLVDGFQANSDGKIYIRSTSMGLRVAIHEGVHKYGGQLFEALLGHVLNEGATDYVAVLVCDHVGVEKAPQYYPNEKKLLKEVLSALEISDEQLFKAYFNDDVAPLVNALVDFIGPEHAVLFRKAKTVKDAVKEFKEGRQLVLSKK